MNKLKEEFLKLALKYAEAKTIAFDTDSAAKAEVSKSLRVANQVVKKLEQLYESARMDGNTSDFEEFMSHENKYVRFSAATYSLATNPELAEKTLKELMELPVPNIVRSDARLSLELWSKGLLSWQK